MKMQMQLFWNLNASTNVRWNGSCFAKNFLWNSRLFDWRVFSNPLVCSWRRAEHCRESAWPSRHHKESECRHRSLTLTNCCRLATSHGNILRFEPIISRRCRPFVQIPNICLKRRDFSRGKHTFEKISWNRSVSTPRPQITASNYFFIIKKLSIFLFSVVFFPFAVFIQSFIIHRSSSVIIGPFDCNLFWIQMNDFSILWKKIPQWPFDRRLCFALNDRWWNDDGF